MNKPREFSLKLTKSEVELVFTEFNVSVDCGAEDPDFPKIRDKAQALLHQIAASQEAEHGRS